MQRTQSPHMQPYPFKHISDHRTYKNTFLQTARIRISYTGDTDDFEPFKTYLHNAFGLSITKELYGLRNSDALRLKAADGKLRAKYTEHTAEYLISGDIYIDFEKSFVPFLDKTQNFLNKAQKQVLSLSIEKIDIWPIVKGDIQDPSAFLNVIISENLRQFRNLVAEDSIYFTEFYDEENQDSLLVRFGFIGADTVDIPNKQPARIILDTLCKHDEQFNADSLLSLARKMNNVLYDAYHWAVSPEVIQIME